MPTRLVREAKAAAARRGTTLTTLIAQTLEHALQAGGERADAVETDLDLGMAWYAKNRSRLVRQYDGKYVAILDGRVIDHDRDFEALAARVFKQVGVRSVFMPRVQAAERPVRMRSPRRASA
jgi:hypothetical protein